MLFCLRSTLLLVFICSKFVIEISFSQAPSIIWQKTIGSNNLDILKNSIHCSDGGFLLMGYSFTGSGIPSGDKSEPGFGKDDGWVVKTDSLGNIVWENLIGGSNADYLVDADNTIDNGYILGGWSSSPISGEKTAAKIGESDYWVIKVDSMGIIEWQQTYGGSNSDQLISIETTTDGGYILGGISYSGATGNKSETSFGLEDFWIVKLNAVGDLEWENTIGGNSNDFFKQIHESTDGYIVCGTSKSGISGEKSEGTIGASGNDDSWIVKLDTFGNIIWQNTIGSFSIDGAADISITSDGGFILLCASNSEVGGDKSTSNIGGYDYWIVKLDNAGNVLWDKTIGGTEDEVANTIQQTLDNGYLIGGYSVSGISGNKSEMNIGSFDYWIVQTDASGIIIWENTIGGTESDRLANSFQTNDGNYLCAGYSSSLVSGDKTQPSVNTDFWIVKLITEGCTIPTGIFTNNITSAKATTNWDFIPDAEIYQLWYREPGVLGWIKKSSVVNYKTIKFLLPETEYEYKVRTKCIDGDFSEFSSLENFTTLPLRKGDLINEKYEIDINIYPNPATNKLNIRIETQHFCSSFYHLTITDLSGKIIYNKQLNALSTVLNISDFSNGIYFVKIISYDTEFGQADEMIEKLIKN